jgi:hypothetical protein
VCKAQEIGNLLYVLRDLGGKCVFNSQVQKITLCSEGSGKKICVKLTSSETYFMF